MTNSSLPSETPRLTSIAVRDYRCFVEQTLELRPLTLLYGWNSAGKSALIRLLGMIGESTRPGATSALNPGSSIGGGAQPAELMWKGKASTAPAGFWLTLNWEIKQGSNTFSSATWHIERRGGGRLFVSGLELRGPDEPIWTAQTQGQPGSFVLQPGAQGSPSTKPENVVFAGLIPHHDASPALELRRRLEALGTKIRWLGTRRCVIPRYFESTAELRFDGDGEGAIETLYADANVRALVQNWYQRAPIQRRLDFRENGSLRYPLLNPAGLSFDVEFADTGSGLGHTLPLLVAAALAEQNTGILVAEEPESHLHTNAQRALAEWFCERALTDSPPTLVLETHSAVFVAAVQLAIAKTPELRHRVGAYWFQQQSDGSSAGPLVTFDAEGRPEGYGWPRGSFADERILARELLDTRYAHEQRSV